MEKKGRVGNERRNRKKYRKGHWSPQAWSGGTFLWKKQKVPVRE